MKIKPIDELPMKKKFGREQNDLKKLLSRFMATQSKYGEVVLDKGEYSSSQSCGAILTNAIRLYKFPLKVKTISGVIHLIRMDMGVIL